MLHFVPFWIVSEAFVEDRQHLQSMVLRHFKVNWNKPASVPCCQSPEPIPGCCSSRRLSNWNVGWSSECDRNWGISAAATFRCNCISSANWVQGCSGTGCSRRGNQTWVKVFIKCLVEAFPTSIFIYQIIIFHFSCIFSFLIHYLSNYHFSFIISRSKILIATLIW